MVNWLDTPLGHHPITLPLLYLICQSIFLIIYLNQNCLYDFLVKQESKFFANIILQLNSFITALNYSVQWVSMWTLLDRYTSDDWLLMFVISIAAILSIIVLTGHPCDLVCAPFILSYDSIEYNVRIGTPFITEKMRESLTNILNYIFYEHLISFLTILSWRGFYTFLDVYLYPDDEHISSGICLIIGYVLFFLLMYIQSYNIGFLPKFLYLNFPNFIQNLRHLCAFFSCVLLWRGYWMLYDTHIATMSIAYQSTNIFYIMCIIISFIILSIMKTASSINGPMSHMDDEYDLFPLYPNCYLVKMFNTQKKSDEISSNSSQITNIGTVTITLF